MIENAPDRLQDVLQAFVTTKKFKGKGPLCVAIVVTQHARNMGLPLDHSKLITAGGGQVLGLGKGAVQTVLNQHGITRVLAAEGGRTSRGSLGNMREYVAFLNDLDTQGLIDLEIIEGFWIDRVRQFFAGKPFKIKLDASRSLRTVIRDVLEQAQDRQKNAPGVYYAGAVMQHLVGAKLDCALGLGKVAHNSFSTADTPGGRAGDFVLEDVAIHVTTSPGEALIAKCRDNLNDGLRPILVTLQKGITVAEGLAENASIADRIDLFEIEQFIALHLYRMSQFKANRKLAVTNLVERYNAIVQTVETDPSLMIEIR